MATKEKPTAEEKPVIEEKSELPKHEGLVSFFTRYWEGLSLPCKIRYASTAIIGLLFFIAYLWWCVNKEFAEFFIYIIGGSLIISQIAISNRRATAAEKTADLTEKNNLYEHFNDAVKNLGHDSTAIQLGGIYALHHIAKQEKDYRERVFEILCAHIRGTTVQEDYIHETSDGKESHEIKPNIQIESILDLLFVKRRYRKIYSKRISNLEGVKLQGALLVGADLKKAILHKANLENAKLYRAELKHARLFDAKLCSAILRETELQGADLSWANLRKANLQGANLNGARLCKADLHDTKNLEVNQLLKVETLYESKLPGGMETEIRKIKPELFERPPFLK